MEAPFDQALVAEGGPREVAVLAAQVGDLAAEEPLADGSYVRIKIQLLPYTQEAFSSFYLAPGESSPVLSKFRDGEN